MRGGDLGQVATVILKQGWAEARVVHYAGGAGGMR